MVIFIKRFFSFSLGGIMWVSHKILWPWQRSRCGFKSWFPWSLWKWVRSTSQAKPAGNRGHDEIHYVESICVVSQSARRCRRRQLSLWQFTVINLMSLTLISMPSTIHINCMPSTEIIMSAVMTVQHQMMQCSDTWLQRTHKIIQKWKLDTIVRKYSQMVSPTEPIGMSSMAVCKVSLWTSIWLQ